MKISAIELSGFRAFAQPCRFDLDADAIIVVGGNGRGKTSMFDGILWALTGAIPRLVDSNAVISKFSDSGEAHVSLSIRAPTGELCKISRSFDGQKQRLLLDINGEVLTESQASNRLLQTIWPSALLATDSNNAFTSSFTRCVYLQQDLVRQFIDSDTDQERFNAVSELIGVGRVAELQLALERSRNAWSRATTLQEKECDTIRSRVTLLRNQMSRLANSSMEEKINIDSTWSDWWQSVLALDINVRPVSVSSMEALSKLDEALKQLESVSRSVRRRIDLASELLLDIQSRSNILIPNIMAMKTESDIIVKKLQSARKDLAAAESLASQQRRTQLELREAKEELQTIAQLALRHLGNDCPVCGQKYDQAGTRKRLQKMINLPIEEEKEDKSTHQVMELALLVENCEKTQVAASKSLAQAEVAINSNRLWLQERDTRLKEIDIEAMPNADMLIPLKNLITTLKKKEINIVKQREKGEKLSLLLGRASELARSEEVEKEMDKTEQTLKAMERSLRSRNETKDLTSRIIDGLRDASYFIVDTQLESVGMLLQRIYATVDPHPVFRTVKFLTTFAQGHGRLDTVIDDPLGQISSDMPFTVLSSSQMNALAVSVFLTFNLSVKYPLNAIIMDDPLQSLDDINLLGLMDLLKRVKDKRQLFVSTHDNRFGKLLERKLRPIMDQKTRVIEFFGWDRGGPTYTTRDIVSDREPIRMAT